MGNFCAPSPLTPSIYCGPHGVCTITSNDTSSCTCASGFSSTLAGLFRAPDCYEPSSFALALELTLLLTSLCSLVVLLCKKPPPNPLSTQLTALALCFMGLFAVTHYSEGGTCGPASLMVLCATANLALTAHVHLVHRANRLFPILLCCSIFLQLVSLEFAINSSSLSDDFAFVSYSAATAAWTMFLNASLVLSTFFHFISKPPLSRFNVAARVLVSLLLFVPSVLHLALQSLPYNYALFLVTCLVVPVLGVKEAYTL